MSLERRNEKAKTLEEVKKYFVDPNSPLGSEDLADLSSDAIRVMAQIYAYGGDIDRMPTKYKDWLQNSNEDSDTLRGVLGLVLAKESNTRRFDSRFLGQIHPHGNKIGILGNLIGAYMNTNMIFQGVSQSETVMEQESIAWLAKTFGFDPEKATGNIVSGGTLANQACLKIARDRVLNSLGLKYDLNKRVETKIPPMYVLTSKWRHYSVEKQCDTLGMGLIEIEADNFRMVPQKLEKAIIGLKEVGKIPVAIVGLAGETETGMIDNLKALAAIAKRQSVFFHVDAAYGGSFMLSRAQTEKHYFDGIQDADSVTIDPHKLLYVPYSAGAFVVKNPNDHDLLHSESRYIRGLSATQEGSRGSGGAIATYATIKLLGREGYKTLLDHTLDLAEYAYREISRSKMLRPLHEPQLNTVLMALSNDFKTELRKGGLKNEQINDVINKMEGTYYDLMEPGKHYLSVNSGVDEDKDAKFNFSGFRYIGNYPYTTEQDVKNALDDLQRVLLERFREKIKRIK
ncbi:MAG: aspartate aminotransferase family protein [Candidatus Woesebacteria bacterium]|nr:MAG: aspartate aminotransferase family protein [Candidatus Woesebacteria bacterium]